MKQNLPKSKLIKINLIFDSFPLSGECRETRGQPPAEVGPGCHLLRPQEPPGLSDLQHQLHSGDCEEVCADTSGQEATLLRSSGLVIRGHPPPLSQPHSAPAPGHHFHCLHSFTC